MMKLSHILGILLVTAFVVLTVLVFLPPADTDEPGSVLLMVGTGHRFMALRLPPAPSGSQEDIVVYDESAALSTPRMALRGPAGRDLFSSAARVRVQLSPQQWQPLDTLRTEWCYTRPLLEEPAAGEPFYEIGLACEFGQPKHYSIPLDELPAELQHLIEAVPSIEQTS